MSLVQVILILAVKLAKNLSLIYKQEHCFPAPIFYNKCQLNCIDNYMKILHEWLHDWQQTKDKMEISFSFFIFV